MNKSLIRATLHQPIREGTKEIAITQALLHRDQRTENSLI